MKYLLNGLQTQRLIFRKIDTSDFNTWLKFHKDPRTTQHWIADIEAPEIVCEKCKQPAVYLLKRIWLSDKLGDEKITSYIFADGRSV